MSDTPTPGPARLQPATVIELLVTAINTHDKAAFYQIAENYSKSLALNGSVRGRIARILSGRPRSFSLLEGLPKGLSQLVSHRAQQPENLFLTPGIGSFVQELLTEWRNPDVYAYHRLGVRNRLLLHGPTGNGKTSLARYLAREMNLPLLEVMGDNVVNSRLGKTGSNIQDIFAGLTQPCVLFWDEVDTIGRRRGDAAHDMGVEVENERMVNSILLNLDRLDQQVIFIGATNRREVLDPAFVRRFDAQLLLPTPTRGEKAAYAQQLLAHHELPTTYAPDDYAVHDSFSDVRQAVVASARSYVAGKVSA